MSTRQPPRVVVVPYDPAWPGLFEEIKSRVAPALMEIAIAIEHVGSTSVPGLAAKPVIDLDAVVSTERDVQTAIHALAGVGYVHRGDLGVPGREAFARPQDLPRHHLYLVVLNNKAYRDHIILRDYLRAHPEACLAYELLKRAAAEKFPHDIDAYIAAKAPFIEGLLCLASQ